MNQEQLEKTIENCKRYGSQGLLLSSCNLTVLPPQIGELEDLITLQLHENQLIELPHEIYRYVNIMV